MFPKEMEILLDIAQNKDSRKQLVNRPMDIINEYISYSCDSLVRRGYIKGNRTKGYSLTPIGRGTLLEFEREHEARVKDTIRKLNQVRVKYSQEMNKLRKEQPRPSREAKRSM